MNKLRIISQRNKNQHLLLITLIVYIATSFFSMFTNYSNYIMVPIVFLWVPVIINEYSHLQTNERAFVAVSLLYLVVIFGYQFLGISKNPFGWQLRYFNWAVSGVMSVVALHLLSRRSLSFLFQVFTVILFILLFVLIRSGVSLLLIEESNEAVSVATTFIGSIYMLISGFGLIIILHIHSFIPRVLATLMLIATLYFNFFIMQRGTNVIFTIGELSLIMIFTIKQRWLLSFLAIVVSFATVFIYASDLYLDLFDWLASVMPSERVARRIEEISFALQYEAIEAGGGSFAARADLMSVSWNTFTSTFTNFLFGVGSNRMENSIIGNHSYFIDTLASYGILGGVLTYKYFKGQYQIMKKYISSRSGKVLFAQCVTVFGFYILRNFYGHMDFTNVNLVILLYFPLVIEFINENVSNHHKKVKL